MKSFQLLNLLTATCIAAGTSSPVLALETKVIAPAPVKVEGGKPAPSASSAPSRLRVGLAFGGGGARGAAEVGVLKVLVDEGIPIDVIAGTSIGSVVGGLYDAGISPDDIAKQFQDAKLMKVFMPVPIVARILLAPVIFTPRLFGYKPYDGLYKGKKAQDHIERLLGNAELKIEKLRIPYAAVATNLVSGQSQRITKGDLATALAASTAVPGIKKPVQIGQELFCDGGVTANIPVKHAREMGADFVIAIDINENLADVPLKTFRKPGSMIQQALRVQLAHSDRRSLDNADIVIHPDTDGINLISKNKADGHKGVEAGIKAAKAAMPELKRLLVERGIIAPTEGVL